MEIHQYNISMPLRNPSVHKHGSKRTSESGFDLDLTYIKPNIIAMSFPYENLEGIFKSRGIRMDEVIKFLDLRHPHHYRVYNLCSERSYDPSRFHMQAVSYPFDVHCPPPFELIQPFCEDVSAYLKADEENVAVVNCCNGIERTGIMICSYLLHEQIFCSTKEALQFFAAARTHDKVGISIPSQRRYVQYYGYILKNNFIYFPNMVLLQSLWFIGIPCPQGGSCSPYFTVTVQKVKAYTSNVYSHNKQFDHQAEFLLPQPLPLCGDVTIEFFQHTRFGGKENMFSFSFNTYFVDMHLLLQQRQRRCTQVPSVHNQSVSTDHLDHTESDGSSTEISKNSNTAQNNSPLLAVPSHSEIKKFYSLNDVHAASDEMAPVTREQRSSSGLLPSPEYQSRKVGIQRTQSNFEFLSKKPIPHDRQLRRVLKKAGKQAGVDITTGFTTVVHKPALHHGVPRIIPKNAVCDPNHTLSPLVLRRLQSDAKVANNTAGMIPISASSNNSVEESLDHHVLVTIVLPLSELDHAVKDEKYFPDNFQLHIILSVDAGLIKDVENDEYLDSNNSQNH